MRDIFICSPPGRVTQVPLPASLAAGQVIALQRVVAAVRSLPPLEETGASTSQMVERLARTATHDLLAAMSAALRMDSGQAQASLVGIGAEILRLLGALVLPHGPHGVGRVSIFRTFEPGHGSDGPAAGQIGSRLRAASEMLELLEPCGVAAGREDMAATLLSVHRQIAEVLRIASPREGLVGEG